MRGLSAVSRRATGATAAGVPRDKQVSREQRRDRRITLCFRFSLFAVLSITLHYTLTFQAASTTRTLATSLATYAAATPIATGLPRSTLALRCCAQFGKVLPQPDFLNFDIACTQFGLHSASLQCFIIASITVSQPTGAACQRGCERLSSVCVDCGTSRLAWLRLSHTIQYGCRYLCGRCHTQCTRWSMESIGPRHGRRPPSCRLAVARLGPDHACASSRPPSSPRKPDEVREQRQKRPSVE